jgi:hypothetical protein
LVLLFGLFLAGAKKSLNRRTTSCEEESEQENQTLLRRARTGEPNPAKKSPNRRTKPCLVLLFRLFLAGFGSPVRALLSRVWFSTLLGSNFILSF